MGDWAALKLALDLLYVPWRVRLVREQPLPDGVPRLLGIAAGDPASERAAVEATGRPHDVVRQAATFFIEQVLLSPEADSYRVLGASPTATTAELRHNMALLMRWLHPDTARQGEQSIFATRIAAAWNDLKTPDRRAAYDDARRSAAKPGNRKPHSARRRDETPDEGPRSAGQRPLSRSARRRRFAAGEPRAGGLPRMLAFLLGRPRR
jgi:hypothetical protein